MAVPRNEDNVPVLYSVYNVLIGSVVFPTRETLSTTPFVNFLSIWRAVWAMWAENQRHWTRLQQEVSMKQRVKSQLNWEHFHDPWVYKFRWFSSTHDGQLSVSVDAGSSLVLCLFCVIICVNDSNSWKSCWKKFTLILVSVCLLSDHSCVKEAKRELGHNSDQPEMDCEIRRTNKDTSLSIYHSLWTGQLPHRL